MSGGMNTMVNELVTRLFFTVFILWMTACSSQDFTGEAPTTPRGTSLNGGDDGAEGSGGADGEDGSMGGLDSGSDSDDELGEFGEEGDDGFGVGDDGLSGEYGKTPAKRRIDVVKGCSEVGSRHSGSTLMSATEGVAMVVIDESGQSLLEVTKTATAARNLRDDIIDYGYIKVSPSALGSRAARIGLCDVRSRSSCLNALRSADRLTGDAGDLRRFESGIVGYGFVSGPVNVLFTSDPGLSGSDNCEVKKSPLVIDLDGSGLVLSRPTRGVLFDIDADGRPNRISWPLRANAGFVALDLNANGKIDDGSELFGDSTLAAGSSSANGFAAMAQYDMNSDGRIDIADPVFASLLIWTDLNFNGVSEPGELLGLASHSIKSLDLDYRNVLKKDQWQNAILQESVAGRKDGTKLPLYDLWFRLID